MLEQNQEAIQKIADLQQQRIDLLDALRKLRVQSLNSAGRKIAHLLREKVSIEIEEKQHELNIVNMKIRAARQEAGYADATA